MKTRVGALLVVCLCSTVLALAADGPANFSGTWTLDTKKSDFGSVLGAGGGGTGRVVGGGVGPTGAGTRAMGPEEGNVGTAPGTGGTAKGGEVSARGRTDSSAGAPRGTEIGLVIEQTDRELKVTRRIGQGPQAVAVTQVYNLSGELVTNPSALGRAEYKSKSVWKKTKLVTEGAQTFATPKGNMEIKLKEEISLSKDGDELIVQTTRMTQDGITTTKLVYRKQLT